ncbi:dynein assembly factor 5, axonemal-like [Pollicipes pollicipes]|uniref:dynein assembly factor 5, axonemal-like n=1 Tax=Pollicipes pollicipes TaxID=41117 RepID=UPI001884CBBC|nr:dynein assembly factor 5, axonemal-like [Pollicipes pollicipes]
MFDQVAQVRLAVTEVAGRWLLELPDRYSFFAKILPLLLTSLRDSVSSVSERASELWRRAGQQYLTENEEEHRQLINYPPPPPAGYPDTVERPSLGCRLLSQRCFYTLLPGAAGDLSDWVAQTRLKVAQLLYTLVLHQEDAVTQYLQRLATALTAALADDEREVVRWVTQTAELLGCFAPFPTLMEVALKPITGDGGATGRQLLLLAAVLRGCPSPHDVAQSVAEVLASGDVCHSHEPVRQVGLLEAAAALLTSASELPGPAVAPLFGALVAVAGHAASEELAQRALHLVEQLAATSGSMTDLLTELGCAPAAAH